MLLFTEYRWSTFLFESSVCLFVYLCFFSDISLQSSVDLLLYIVVNAFTLSISAKQTCRVSAMYLSSAVFILLNEICLVFCCAKSSCWYFVCLFCHFSLPVFSLPLSIFVLYCYDKSPGPYEILFFFIFSASILRKMWNGFGIMS